MPLSEEFSETWGVDLRESRKKGEALADTFALCRRAGIEIRHRNKGWSTRLPDRPWRAWWPDQINVMVDYVNREAEARLR